MRFAFIFTDDNAPAISAGNVTKIEETTVNNVKQIVVTLADSTTRTYSKSQGQPAILWD